MGCGSRSGWGLVCEGTYSHPQMQAMEALNTLEPEQQVLLAANITQELIQATESKQFSQSLLPNDLGATARIVTVIVQVLENNNSTDEVLNTYTPVLCTTSFRLYCLYSQDISR